LGTGLERLDEHVLGAVGAVADERHPLALRADRWVEVAEGGLGRRRKRLDRARLGVDPDDPVRRLRRHAGNGGKAATVRPPAQPPPPDLGVGEAARAAAQGGYRVDATVETVAPEEREPALRPPRRMQLLLRRLREAARRG